jgi:hypothetical protein
MYLSSCHSPYVAAIRGRREMIMHTLYNYCMPVLAHRHLVGRIVFARRIMLNRFKLPSDPMLKLFLARGMMQPASACTVRIEYTGTAAMLETTEFDSSQKSIKRACKTLAKSDNWFL